MMEFRKKPKGAVAVIERLMGVGVAKVVMGKLTVF